MLGLSCVTGVEGLEIKAFYRVTDEGDQMTGRQPLLQGTGQEALLIGLGFLSLRGQRLDSELLNLL